MRSLSGSILQRLFHSRIDSFILYCSRAFYLFIFNLSETLRSLYLLILISENGAELSRKLTSEGTFLQGPAPSGK